MLLAGDVGATKANLALYSPEAGPRAPLAEMTLASAHYPDLESLVRTFLDEVQAPIERVCLGVAGPVVEGRAAISNLAWRVDQAALCRALGIADVRLVNDLLATAYAIPYLEAGDLHEVNRGEPAQGGARAIIAPGTGLGMAFVTWDGNRYWPHASEGGHADFAPNGALQGELWRALQARFGHVSRERVCSGLGIANIYAFLRARGAEEPRWLSERLAAAEDPTPIIVEAALADSAVPSICAETLRLFVEILAAEAGNLALTVLATGGVYLGGGIPPRILRLLEPEPFMRAFCAKGRMAELLAQVPVTVILNPKAALLGAAVCGLEPL